VSVSVCVCAVDYSTEMIVLKWIQEGAVQFDPGGKDDSQFSIRESVLQNCSLKSTDGQL